MAMNNFFKTRVEATEQMTQNWTYSQIIGQESELEQSGMYVGVISHFHFIPEIVILKNLWVKLGKYLKVHRFAEFILEIDEKTLS